jgi:hypothetical protein
MFFPALLFTTDSASAAARELPRTGETSAVPDGPCRDAYFHASVRCISLGSLAVTEAFAGAPGAWRARRRRQVEVLDVDIVDEAIVPVRPARGVRRQP